MIFTTISILVSSVLSAGPPPNRSPVIIGAPQNGGIGSFCNTSITPFENDCNLYRQVKEQYQIVEFDARLVDYELSGVQLLLNDLGTGAATVNTVLLDILNILKPLEEVIGKLKLKALEAFIKTIDELGQIAIPWAKAIAKEAKIISTKVVDPLTSLSHNVVSKIEALGKVFNNRAILSVCQVTDEIFTNVCNGEDPAELSCFEALYSALFPALDAVTPFIRTFQPVLDDFSKVFGLASQYSSAKAVVVLHKVQKVAVAVDQFIHRKFCTKKHGCFSIQDIITVIEEIREAFFVDVISIIIETVIEPVQELIDEIFADVVRQSLPSLPEISEFDSPALKNVLALKNQGIDIQAICSNPDLKNCTQKLKDEKVFQLLGELCAYVPGRPGVPSPTLTAETAVATSEVPVEPTTEVPSEGSWEGANDE